MHICIRADSSLKIGTGHVMRCLTIAKHLQKRGAAVGFICRTLKGNLNEWIQQQGFPVYEIEEEEEHFNWNVDAERTKNILLKRPTLRWLIVDHYDIDAKWESTLRPFTKKIMVIDDLANRKHDCDLILDQNSYINFEHRYDELVPTKAKKLLGPNYLILREQFLNAKQHLSRNVTSINRLLVSFGGTDQTNETLKTLKAIKNINSPLHVDVVVGANNEYKEKIKAWCLEYENINYHCQIDDMATFIKRADLSIGAGGSSSYERCYLGLPTLVVETASNQSGLIDSLRKEKVIHYLGKSSEVTVQQLTEELQKMIDDPVTVRELTERCLKLFNQHLCINNVIEHIWEG